MLIMLMRFLFMTPIWMVVVVVVVVLMMMMLTMVVESL